MKTIAHQTISTPYVEKKTSAPLWKKFIGWAEGQQQNRLGWLAAVVTSHACIITPLAVSVVFMGGNNIILFMAAIMAMGLVLVVNLAALTTKITIPAFFLSLVTDILVLAIAIMNAIDLNRIHP